MSNKRKRYIYKSNIWHVYPNAPVHLDHVVFKKMHCIGVIKKATNTPIAHSNSCCFTQDHVSKNIATIMRDQVPKYFNNVIKVIKPS